ncbi:hypothetical protein [Pseudoalteromonas umbrosa]|uniref:hypothetical protein n=1 Tax=Pseudoalteromonas umbrosa TaxID=3048489 RepID=UPI0024C400DF|nr:hypothetical protein [Pseudoalteromonas sp. B95]MDK1290124.1 hypothetical protein [Pseudoalteromonas sp. B95]
MAEDKKATSRLKRKSATEKKVETETVIDQDVMADDVAQTQINSSYFTSDKSGIDFIPSGSTTLDEVLGGGWAVGRIANVVGDRSAGKTLVATEAAANFNQLWPDEPIFYLEAEAAFDAEYAAAMGMPVEAVTFVEMFDDAGNADNTVEFLFEHLQMLIKARADGDMKFEKCLYVVDSLDALSDRDEKQRDNDKGSYGMGKQKKLSEMFRRIVAELEKAGITLLVISQIREKIGVTFGEKYTRSGGKALDFYCSQIVWLAEIGKIKRTVRRQERVAGVKVKAKCKKNKVSLPFRECEYSIEFGYGIDNLSSCLEFLKSTDSLDELTKTTVTKTALANAVKKIKKMDDDEYYEVMTEITALVKKRWREIDDSFLPERSKYGRKRLK